MGLGRGGYEMTLLNKNKALYVKACVIVNGVQDQNGDTLNAIDIKRIFTSYGNQDKFEVHHNNIPIEEVSLLENYISTDEEVIAGTTIPKGSWNAVIRVDNPEIQQMLKNGDFGGVSLFNRVKPKCAMGLKGEINYSDLKSAECVIPLFISFVKDPANDVGLEILNYDVYIKKSKNNGEHKMSLLEKLRNLVKEAEAEQAKTEEPTDDEKEKVGKTVEAEQVTDSEPTTAKEEKTKEAKVEEKEEEAEVQDKKENEEATIEKQSEAKNTEEVTEKVSEKAPQEEDLKAEIEFLKAEISKINDILAKLQEKEEVEEIEEIEEKPVITKSAKITVTNEETTNKDFYEMTGRDPITGKRIRKQTKILN